MVEKSASILLAFLGVQWEVDLLPDMEEQVEAEAEEKGGDDDRYELHR